MLYNESYLHEDHMATLSVDISWSRWPPGRQDSASRLPTTDVDSVWFIDKTRHSQNLFQRVYHRNYGILGYWGLYCVAFDILNVYIWDRQDLGGPHVGPMNFSTWDYIPISGKLTSAQLLIGKFGGIPLYYIAMDSKNVNGTLIYNKRHYAIWQSHYQSTYRL